MGYGKNVNALRRWTIKDQKVSKAWYRPRSDVFQLPVPKPFWTPFSRHRSQITKRLKNRFDKAIGNRSAMLFKVDDDLVQIVGNIASQQHAAFHGHWLRLRRATSLLK